MAESEPMVISDYREFDKFGEVPYPSSLLNLKGDINKARLLSSDSGVDEEFISESSDSSTSSSDEDEISKPSLSPSSESEINDMLEENTDEVLKLMYNKSGDSNTLENKTEFITVSEINDDTEESSEDFEVSESTNIDSDDSKILEDEEQTSPESEINDMFERNTEEVLKLTNDKCGDSNTLENKTESSKIIIVSEINDDTEENSEDFEVSELMNIDSDDSKILEDEEQASKFSPIFEPENSGKTEANSDELKTDSKNFETDGVSENNTNNTGFVGKKVDAKEQLRSDLQSLLKTQEEEMVKLATSVDSTTMYEKVVEKKVEEFDHNMFFQQYASAFNTNQTDGEEPSIFTIGFSDDGKVAASIEEKNDEVGVSEIVLTEDAPKDPNDDVRVTENHSKNDITSENPEQVLDSTPSETGSSMIADQNMLEETTQEFGITRRSLRERKPKTTQIVTQPKKKIDYLPTPEQLFGGLDLKMMLLEGHHDDTCAVDLYDNFVVSGGRDTSLKLWVASSQEELKSLGGHESAITGVCFMKDKLFSNYPNCVTASHDCSVRVWDLEKGTSTRSIYVYSPVVCLDYSNGKAAIGTEGGKVELYDVESGEQLFTVNAFDYAVSAIKLFPNGNIVAGSADGIIKVYDPKDASKAIFELDPDTIKVVPFNKDVTVTEDTVTTAKLHQLKVNCMVLYKDLIIYGDDGYNVKVLDYQKGEVVKVCNNVKEYCPTETLSISSVFGRDYLFSVGSDVDSGDSYINVRVLPELRYISTIHDIYLNSGSITSFVLQVVNSKIRFITGGSQLRTWDQEVRRGRKRKSTVAAECLIPCKYVMKYEESRESETEPELEDDSWPQTPSVEASTEKPSKSYCTIL